MYKPAEKQYIQNTELESQRQMIGQFVESQSDLKN